LLIIFIRQFLKTFDRRISASSLFIFRRTEMDVDADSFLAHFPSGSILFPSRSLRAQKIPLHRGPEAELKTEPLYMGAHQIIFNRAAAASQAYNGPPAISKKERFLTWKGSASTAEMHRQAHTAFW
jgi:hypothetical protein